MDEGSNIPDRIADDEKQAPRMGRLGMGMLKRISRGTNARELGQCVEDNRPYSLMDIKLYLTHRCNLRCGMCASWTEEWDERDELSTDDWMRVIAQAKPLGLANLKLFGGEPMLRRDLPDIVEYASGQGIRCTLITNGTLLTEERAHALVEAGLAELDLSLDASRSELHDSIRGVPGAWTRTVHGLQSVRETARMLDRRVVIRVNAVVMRQNLDDMPRLVEVFSALAVDEIALNPVVPQGKNSRAALPGYVLERGDIIRYNSEIAPRIAERATRFRLSKDRDHLYIYGTNEQDIDQAALCRYAERLQVKCCFKPWYYMTIRENGDVVGCNTVKHPLARMGNVRRTSVAEIWFSEQYQAFRAKCKPPHFADCANCCYHFALVNQQILREVCPRYALRF
jgi:pyrroloquinoline quinone biosynthesis protein E